MLNKDQKQVKVTQLVKHRAGLNLGRPWDLCTGSPLGIDGSSQTVPLLELPCLRGGAKDKVGPLLGPNHLCGLETEEQGSKDLASLYLKTSCCTDFSEKALCC